MSPGDLAGSEQQENSLVSKGQFHLGHSFSTAHYSMTLRCSGMFPGIVTACQVIDVGSAASRCAMWLCAPVWWLLSLRLHAIFLTVASSSLLWSWLSPRLGTLHVALATWDITWGFGSSMAEVYKKYNLCCHFYLTTTAPFLHSVLLRLHLLLCPATHYFLAPPQ